MDYNNEPYCSGERAEAEKDDIVLTIFSVSHIEARRGCGWCPIRLDCEIRKREEEGAC